MDEDPAGCQRWISRKEIKSVKILRTKNEKFKDHCKADYNNVDWIPNISASHPSLLEVQVNRCS